MTKELKRKRGKKVIESEGDEENSKDNVFRLGEYDKHKWGYKNNGIVPDLIRL
ncbi:13650_t:CDS:2 [Rhizophagus irregularis]|nr:13650_t:CDS:2 [Rhizophagus irregularis]